MERPAEIILLRNYKDIFTSKLRAAAGGVLIGSCNGVQIMKRAGISQIFTEKRNSSRTVLYSPGSWQCTILFLISAEPSSPFV